jgi:dTMP kinase
MSKPLARGRFITLEGIDGAGKSTHLAYLSQLLSTRGLTPQVTREPGGTPLGEALRELVLNQSMHQDTEALLMFASRREHLSAVIMPALLRGEWVVCDRFTDASFAYQGGGRGMSLQRLQTLEHFVHPDTQPDLTLLFDVPAAVAESRRQNARAPDRFEQEQLAFFDRVRTAYLHRAEAFPERFLLIDGNRSITEIRAVLDTAVAALIDRDTHG